MLDELFFDFCPTLKCCSVVVYVRLFQNHLKWPQGALLGEKLATIRGRKNSLVWEKVFSLKSDFYWIITFLFL